MSTDSIQNLFEHQNSENASFIRDDPSKNSTKGLCKFLIIVLIVILIMVALYVLLVKTGIMDALIFFVNDKLVKLYKNGPFLTCFVILLIHIVNSLLCLPFRTILTFIVVSIIKNYWISFFFCLFCGLASSSILFLISSTRIKPYLLKKFSDSLLFKILLKFGKKSPWRTCFLTRLLYISSGIKDYFLALVDVPYLCFIVSAVVLQSLLILEIIFVHKEMGELRAFINKTNISWSERSMSQKVSTVIIGCTLLFTTVFMLYMGFKITRLVEIEKEKEEKRKSSMHDIPEFNN
jgi:hypothetical protein